MARKQNALAPLDMKCRLSQFRYTPRGRSVYIVYNLERVLTSLMFLPNMAGEYDDNFISALYKHGAYCIVALLRLES